MLLLSLAALALRLTSNLVLSQPQDDATAASRPAEVRTNPVIYEDFADNDITRVDDTYYFSASTMHFSPGAPILRSQDLVNWEFIGHSVPRLDFLDDNAYGLVNSTAYIRGIWASTLRFRPSNGKWYWIGCVDWVRSFVYTADAVDGEWTQAGIINNCYYDCGLFVDEDGNGGDKLYVAYGGNTQLSVAQLDDTGTKEVSNQVVFTFDVGREGNRMYKREGFYYIITDVPGQSELVLRSQNPLGPYEKRTFWENVNSPIPGSGTVVQGSLIDTPEGDWYFMSFAWAFPEGRSPVLAPITWTEDGWPQANFSGNSWPTDLAFSLPTSTGSLQSWTGVDKFTSFGVEWEWNHNPVNSAWSIEGGLVLKTASVTDDLYKAKNTACHRILGPKANGTILIDVSGMTDGDRAGISMFRDLSGYIAVQQSGTSRNLVMRNNVNLSPQDPGGTCCWSTTNKGDDIATTEVELSGNQVWLRVSADISSSGSKEATFSYSTDGNTFMGLGNTLKLNDGWQFFMGYRFGIFNFATRALGGSVVVKSFEHVSA
ncbi:hypothetical protein E1B28_009466 [Marasmius oreades]|uniref:Beta-xylosidase C-terminal Concanavalin A-like domain-containing protein n=1 Tax=Marasmius oreades TaxID=181124 RepID=A0A9P7URQ7_9AGAR|nr:uncharacterized protein E1B28_009466 [Marasmius oreades]KAG7090346.1 hypothetical protein E1B28_009466 [Marasmius oreades]